MRTEKRHVRIKLEELSDYFENLSRDIDPILELHLSVRIIFKKYVSNLNCSDLSREIQALHEKLQRTEISKTVAKNIAGTLDRMCQLGFVPHQKALDPPKALDPLSKHSPPEIAISISKILTCADKSKNEISKAERKSLIRYLELTRGVLRTPERVFVRSIKVLRDQKTVSRSLIGSGKVEHVLYRLWEINWLDHRELNAENHSKLMGRLEKAFLNEKNPEVR